MKRFAVVFVLSFLPLVSFTASAEKLDYPDTPKRPVVEEIQGVQITDNYRWLEDASSPEVKAWTEAQNKVARAYLDKLPVLEPIKSKLQEWNSFHSPIYRSLDYRGGTFFSLKLQPPQNQPVLVTFSSPDNLKDERILVDPNKIDSNGTTAIDFYSPSVDGKYVAVSLSKGGSEIGTLHFFEVDTGKQLPDQIPSVTKPTAGGSVAWNRDGSGIFYTRYPAPGERAEADLDFYQQIYFHKLGDDLKNDQYSLGKDFPRIAEIMLATSEDGKRVLASVANGDGGEFAHYILNPGRSWVQITQFKDKVIWAQMGTHDDLYLLSRKGAPRGKILKLSLNNPKLAAAKTIVKEGPAVVGEIVPTENFLYTVDLVGGPSQVRVFDLNGKQRGLLKVAPVSDVSYMIKAAGDQVYFSSQSYVEPLAWYQFTPSTAGSEKWQPTKTAMVFQSPVDFSDIQVNREWAKSKDGAKVPLTILSRKGTKRDGTNPTLLTGYGGYGINITPRFMPDVHLWLENGGVLAIGNIRGGGEFGEAWHHGGNLTKKQNVFDDFIACGEHLIQAKYTDKKHLAIEGGSNGGLLMGAVLTQRPDLFGAVVSHVGIYDMLHVENDPNGAFNVTEFGTVKDPALFKALYAYSPLHHVKDGTAYPPILLMEGVNDGRVNPYHSKKMAARLQAATSSGNPVLLRVNYEGGHGIGRSLSQKVEEEAAVDAFLFTELGMKYSPTLKKD